MVPVAALFLLLCSVVLPIANAQCPSGNFYYKNYTATFDTLPANRAPPANYKSVNWHNFIVTHPGDITPHSKPAVLQPTDTNLGYISQGSNPPGGQIQFGISSFYLGCTILLGPDETLPVGCTITVTTKTITSIIDIQQYNYTYEPGRQNGQISFNMHKKDTGLIAGQFIYFSLAGGPGGASVYLDNVVISQLACKKGGSSA